MVPKMYLLFILKCKITSISFYLPKMIIKIFYISVLKRNKKICYFALWISLFFLCSCQELGGNKTLTCPRKSTIDTAVIGVWQFIDSKEYNQFKTEIEPHSLIILPFNQNEYILMFTSDRDSSNVPTLFRALESQLFGKRIANVQPIQDKPTHDFIYYPFKISGDTLYYWGFYIAKVSTQIENNKSIKKFITKHYNDTNYFSSVRKYLRIKTNKFLPK